MSLETLRTVAANWLPVLLVTLGTLALSLAAGQALRLQRGISRVTGAFAMIAGGASGIIVMARELGADERMVAVLQYLRVLLIVVLMPVVATTLYGASRGSGSDVAADGPGWPIGLLFVVGCGVVGLVLGRLVRLPVPALLGPMLVAAGLELSGLARGVEVPALVQSAAFLVIGLQVGISFTRDSLRTIGRALPLALAVIVVLIVASAGLGLVLSRRDGRECPRRVSRHHSGRALRGAGDRDRQRCGCDVRARRPGAPPVRGAAERAAPRAVAAPGAKS